MNVESFSALLPQPRDPSACLPCWERLDRTVWRAGLAFYSFGASLGVRVNDPSVWPQIATLLPPKFITAESPLVETLFSLRTADPETRPGVRPYHLLYRGIEQIARTRDFAEALGVLESHLHTQTAEAATDALFVHAGVAAWRGRAIVVPGRSFSGKTSLTAALVRAGAEYLSDEYAVFGADGLVSPYPKTLSLRDGAGQPLEKRTAESLGGRVAAGPLPVALILDTRFVPEARWRPRAVSAGAALWTLLDNTVQVRRRPEWALSVLNRAVAGTRAVKSRRGEADAVAAWALNQLEAE